MAAVKWKEPLFISIPVGLLVLSFLLSCSHSQWISYRRSGRNSNLWHPNMPAPRTLRHSSRSNLGGPSYPPSSSSSSSSSYSSSHNSQSRSGSSSSDARSRQIDHRTLNHGSGSNSNNNNYYTISSKDSSSSSNHGAYQQQQQQPRYSSADFSRNPSSGSSSSSSSSGSGKNVRISDIPARSSSSGSPSSASYQRSLQQQSQHIPSNVLTHRHLQMSVQQPPKNKMQNWQTAGAAAGKNSNSGNGRNSAVPDSTRRPVSQQAGHLLDSWPNSNTHHHLAPVPPTMMGALKQNHNGKTQGFSNMKPEAWGNNVLVSNKPIEIKAKPIKPKQELLEKQQGIDRQLVLPKGYPVKDKAAVASTINTLTKLSPKKPIFVFMRKEGILAVKAGADAGDVIKKLAGTSKLPFYNGTMALPSRNMPTVFLAPEDMTPPTGYGKIPIPNLKPKTGTTPKPTYSKILMPGGTHMKGSLITTSTTTPTPEPLASAVNPIFASPPNSLFGGPPTPATNQSNDFSNINNLSLEQKLQLLQLLRNQPNHPMADHLAMAILSAAAASPSPSPSAASSPAFPSVAPSPNGLPPIVQGPNLALPSQPPTSAGGVGGPDWASHFQNVLPQGAVIDSVNGQHPGAQLQGFPNIAGIVSSTTLSPLLSTISPSPSGEPATGGEGDIHKLIGTIVESAVSNTVSTMLQHQRIMQQQGQPQHPIIGVGPPLHAHNLPGAPSRPPPPPHFQRGPPPPGPPRPPQGPPPPRFGFPQRPPFPPSPTPGRFPPPHPSAIPPPPPQHPSALPPQHLPPNPSATPPQNPTGAPPQFQQIQQIQQQQQQQASQQRPFHQVPPQQQQIQGPYQHPFVPQFQQQPNYPTASTPRADGPATGSSTPLPPPGQPQQQPLVFNPSSTPSPPPQMYQQFPPNGLRPNGKPPGMRLIERPFPSGKSRNPLHNALQFFGISTPRPDPGNKSPSPTPIMMSSTPYPRPPPSPTPPPFRQPPGPFPSSTPGPLRFPPSPYPPQHPLQQQFNAQQQQQHQFNIQQQQQQQFNAQQQQVNIQQQQQQQASVQIGVGEGKDKKPTLIVQTPVQGANGPTGKKNTYVISGGGELPELGKIMKVLNELNVETENSPSQPPPPHQQQYASPSPSSPTSPRPAIFASSSISPQFPTQRPYHVGPTQVPNVIIKNANVGITPSPSPIVSSSTAQPQFVSTTPNYNGGVSVSPSPRPQFVSSTGAPISNVSPVMQIIQSIQSQIPGVQINPSVETQAQKHSHQQIQVQVQQQHPHIQVQQQQQQQHIRIQQHPRPVSVSPRPSPTPNPGQVMISSTGFPRVINVNPGSATPAAIHQAVVDAIMKQQASDAMGPTPGSIVIGGSPTPGPIRGSTPGYSFEVIPVGGGIPGLNDNQPFDIQALIKQQQEAEQQQQQQHVTPSPVSPTEQQDGSQIALNDATNVVIQRGSLESHETFTERARKPSYSSSSLESSERPRPVYSKERSNSKPHHHSKEVSDEEYPEKGRRPVYSKEQAYEHDENQNPNRRIYSGETHPDNKYAEISEEEGKKATKELSEEEKLIEKVITEEKIVWKQGPNEGELIPSKVRTEERILIRPNSGGSSRSKESPTRVVTDTFSQRRTPLSSAEHYVTMGRTSGGGSVEAVADKSSASEGLISKEIPGVRTADSPSNFAGILRSKLKFDRMMERLYPSKQLVSPFTITNNSANFHRHQHHYHSGETIVPTIASSLITTPHQQEQQIHLASVSPTMPTLGGVSSTPFSDPGRFRIRPGDISHIQEAISSASPTQKAQQQNLILGVTPSGQPIIFQSSSIAEADPLPSNFPSPSTSQEPSSSSTTTGAASSMAPGTVEQRLIFIPHGTASSPLNSKNPQILITTVDELPDLMAQLGGTNPEIRMVPDKATLEAELAKVAATSTAEAATTKVTSPTTTTTTTTTTTSAVPPSSPPTMPTQPAAPSVQSTLFRLPPTPEVDQGIRRMDGPEHEQAFTWRPANATMASPISTTLSFANQRRLVSGLGAGMLHAMSAGFGNIGNTALNKFSWLGPSAMPLPQQQPTQMLYAMQNGIPVQVPVSSVSHQKLPIAGPYQQVLIPSGSDGKQQVDSMGYYGYKWDNLASEQPPTAPTTTTSTSITSTKTPDYRLKYRSQYRDDEIPVGGEEKVKPVAPVHKLRKGSKRVKTTTKTTASPIDPVSQEEYEDDDDVEQDLIHHDTMVPKHAGRNKNRQGSKEDDSDEDDSSPEDNSAKRRHDTRRQRPTRRRRPGKLTDEEEDDGEEDSRKHRTNRRKLHPTKPTYDEEDDASPAPKGNRGKSHGHHGRTESRARSDQESSEDAEDEEDYDVYDVKPVFNVKRKKQQGEGVPAPPTTAEPVSTSTAANKNKAIYVNREMFLVSGEEKGHKGGHNGNPKAEPVYQPVQPAVSSLKLPVLQAPSIISGQSVVKKTGSTVEEKELPEMQPPTKPSTTQEPKPTSASTTTTTLASTTTTKLTTAAAQIKKILSTKATPTASTKGKKKKDDEDYSDTQDELKALLKKIQDRLQTQDEVYDFGEDGLYDYYDEIQQVLSTKATTTTTSTKGTQKPKKSKNKKGKKNKKSKKNKKNKKGKKEKKQKKTKTAVTQRPVTTSSTTQKTVFKNQRHPISSMEAFTLNEDTPKTSTTTTTTTSTTTTTTTTTPPPPPPPPSEEVASSASGSVESTPDRSSVSYVFSETAKDNLPKMKRRPLWVRRRVGVGAAMGSSEALQPLRSPNGPPGKVIRLVRRRRPIGNGRRRMMQQQQLQTQSFEQQGAEQQPQPTTTIQPTTSTQSASIEVAPPNYSSPPLEKYFEQNSLEHRVGNPDSVERTNGTVTLRSPKRKLKLIRLKGQRAQWRLRLQGAGDDSSSEAAAPRPAALIAPREVSAPLPLQAPLPAPVFTSEGLHSSSNSRLAKSASSDLISHYSTSFSNSESSSVETKVCIKGKCEFVSRQ